MVPDESSTPVTPDPEQPAPGPVKEPVPDPEPESIDPASVTAEVGKAVEAWSPYGGKNQTVPTGFPERTPEEKKQDAADHAAKLREQEGE